MNATYVEFGEGVWDVDGIMLVSQTVEPTFL